MTNDEMNDDQNAGLGRRDLETSATAGVAATAAAASAAELPVVETDVEIKMPDGTCDAALIQPKSGSHPAC